MHNTLLALVHDKRISREHIEKLYVYVSIKTKRAAEQVARRREWLDSDIGITPDSEVAITTVIEVLLELIRAGKVLIAPAVVVERLRVRGVHITIGEIEQVFAHYGLEALKKLHDKARNTRGVEVASQGSHGTVPSIHVNHRRCIRLCVRAAPGVVSYHDNVWVLRFLLAK